LSTAGSCELTVIDARIEAMNVAVISEDSYERQEIGPLESVFVQIFWRAVTRCYHDNSTRKEFSEESLQDHSISNVCHLNNCLLIIKEELILSGRIT
jgi:hypothetical protein